MTAFLADPALSPLWRAVQEALDRNGLDWRGRLTLPALPPEGRRRLSVLAERPITVRRRSVRLTDLENGVVRVTGRGLVPVLGELGYPPAGRREALVARRDETRERRRALNAAVRLYAEHGDTADAVPDGDDPEVDGRVGHSWIDDWRDAVWRDGLLAHRSPEEIHRLVGGVWQVLGAARSGRSRTELAARLFGDAHELDSTTRICALVTRAFVARDGPVDDEREAWERAGIPLDLVSSPVLSWGLPLIGESGVAEACRAMTAAGLPLHLSMLALRTCPLRVPEGTALLVVENPRLVEAAAERALPAAVLCANGNPTTAPVTAITQLRDCRARLRYHGDFDSPGLAIAGRAQRLGCTPFQMGADDYLAAVREATTAGVGLPVEAGRPPETPWCRELASVFDEHRAVVHEERVMDRVLDAHAERR